MYLGSCDVCGKEKQKCRGNQKSLCPRESKRDMSRVWVRRGRQTDSTRGVENGKHPLDGNGGSTQLPACRKVDRAGYLKMNRGNSGSTGNNLFGSRGIDIITMLVLVACLLYVNKGRRIAVITFTSFSPRFRCMQITFTIWKMHSFISFSIYVF